MKEFLLITSFTVLSFTPGNVGVNAGMRRWRGRISTTVIFLMKMLDKYQVRDMQNHLNNRLLWGSIGTVIFTYMWLESLNIYCFRFAMFGK